MGHINNKLAKPGKFFKNLRRKKMSKKNIKKFRSTKREKKLLDDQSFTFGLTDRLEEEKFVYYSDDEKKRKEKAKKGNQKFSSLIDTLIHFNEDDKEKRIKRIKKQRDKKLKKKLAKRVDENTFEGLDALIAQYNLKRGKENKINIPHNMKCTIDEQEREIKQNSISLGCLLLQKLRIFRDYKEAEKIKLDYDKLYDKEKKAKDEKEKKSFTKKNINNVLNIDYIGQRKVMRYYPDLISLNIPRVLRAFPKLKRTVLYDIFIQFKLLLTICVCINKNLKLIKKGIDFESFFNCIPQMRSQGKTLAMKIYNTLNKLNTEFLNWEEYLTGMLTMKSNNITEKMEIFFKVIDTDGNGLLSFDEVYELSMASLKRTIGEESDEEDEVVTVLATYFANLIFQLVDKPIDEEIPLDLIREKIAEGKSAAGYLEMFICADGFS